MTAAKNAPAAQPAQETPPPAVRPASEDLWVFGYGSLMWRPGFAHEERVHARLHGHRRALCIYSYNHRGTREKPGLVLGLDSGGSCHGVAYRVAAPQVAATRAYLTEREQISMVYRESLRPVKLRDGRRVTALVYLVDRNHRQYAGALSRETQLAHVLQGVGKSGANPDYVLATHAHLIEMGVHDATLDWLAERLRDSR